MFAQDMLRAAALRLADGDWLACAMTPRHSAQFAEIRLIRMGEISRELETARPVAITSARSDITHKTQALENAGSYGHCPSVRV